MYNNNYIYYCVRCVHQKCLSVISNIALLSLVRLSQALGIDFSSCVRTCVWPDHVKQTVHAHITQPLRVIDKRRQGVIELYWNSCPGTGIFHTPNISSEGIPSPIRSPSPSPRMNYPGKYYPAG